MPNRNINTTITVGVVGLLAAGLLAVMLLSVLVHDYVLDWRFWMVIFGIAAALKIAYVFVQTLLYVLEREE